jgi:hypothetical protein
MLRLSLEWHSDINHVQIREVSNNGCQAEAETSRYVQDIHVIFAAEDDLQVTFSKYFIILLNMFSV